MLSATEGKLVGPVVFVRGDFWAYAGKILMFPSPDGNMVRHDLPAFFINLR